MKNKTTTAEYPISPNYCKSWTITEAIRELIANAKDTRQNFEAYWQDGWGIIQDKADGIQKSHLILGEGEDKSQDQIGQFGEGLKIAALVCARENRKFEGKTKSFSFSASIKESKTFETKVMAITFGNQTISEGTRIRFQCTKEEMQAAKGLFLHGSFNTEKSFLLRDKPGCLFINGVFTQEANTLFGYNIADKTSANRDRSILDMNKVQEQIAEAWKDVDNWTIIARYLKAKGQPLEHNVELKTWKHQNAWRKALISIYGQKYCISEPTFDKFAQDRDYTIIECGSFNMKWTLITAGVKTSKEILKNEEKPKLKVIKNLSKELLDKLNAGLEIASKALGTDTLLEVQVVESLEGNRYELSSGGNYSIAQYDPIANQISIVYQFLKDLSNTELIGTLIHEGVHKSKGFHDITREFESELTSLAGQLACAAYQS